MEILAVEKTLNIDLYGPEKAVNCAEDSDVKQYLQVSATDSLYPEAAGVGIKPYAVSKHMSDFYIQQSSLNYTIVQPGPLSDEVT